MVSSSVDVGLLINKILWNILMNKKTQSIDLMIENFHHYHIGELAQARNFDIEQEYHDVREQVLKYLWDMKKCCETE